MKKTLMAKAILLISGMAFLVLITSGRTPALVGCVVVAVLMGGVIFSGRRLTYERLKNLGGPLHGALGLGLCSVLGFNFYDRWLDSRGVVILSGLFRMGQDKLTLVCTIAVVLASVPAVWAVLSFFVSQAAEELRAREESEPSPWANFRNIPMKKAFGILTVIYLLGISAILRANFNYIDDMGRVANGSRSWINYSRFLTEALSNFVHMDRYLTDVSPLPQLIAVLFLAAAGILLLYVVYERTCFSLWELIAVIPLGLNPYFLECISYKYDAPYMALSILGAILPFLYKKKNGAVWICASAIGTTIVCTTYQAAAGIYPMIVILLMFKMWCRKESAKKAGIFCLQSAAGFCLGLAFFKLILMNPVEATYGSGALASTKIGDLLQIIYYNLRHYYTLIGEDFKRFWILLVLVLAVGFLWTVVRFSGRNRILSAVLAVISLFLMGIICFGAYPALGKTLFAPRAMYGFGVLITLLGVCAVEGCGGTVFRAPSFLLSLAFFVFALTYGNALYSQKEYTDFRIRMVIEDMNDMEVFLSEEPVVVQVSGMIGYSPVIRNMPQNYSILNRLIPITFQGGWWWGQAGFYQYYDLKNVTRDPSVDLTAYDLPVLEEHMFHVIRGKDNYILIELK
ncbi:hypothetical protein IMSAG185_00117 [Lachnospiraceae bacterium]|nr:hypothetical protein [Lachnospiraceae bacterium]GFI64528.1 hypothetical protein IMSAG185_00117 [Lachnospiraceae bacterium]